MQKSAFRCYPTRSGLLKYSLCLNHHNWLYFTIYSTVIRTYIAPEVFHFLFFIFFCFIKLQFFCYSKCQELKRSTFAKCWAIVLIGKKLWRWYKATENFDSDFVFLLPSLSRLSTSGAAFVWHEFASIIAFGMAFIMYGASPRPISSHWFSVQPNLTFAHFYHVQPNWVIPIWNIHNSLQFN